jgi:LysM repeat protein
MFARIVIVIGICLVLWAVIVRPSEGAAPERVYVVKPADTLWSIAAARYAGDTREAIWNIQRRNGLESTLLVPGQRLVLPPA